MNGKTINWYDQVYQRGLRNNQNISLSGQGGELNYYWSLGYIDNEGTIVGERFRTVRTRLNLEATIADYVKIGINSQYSNMNNGYLGANSSQVPFQSPLNCDI